MFRGSDVSIEAWGFVIFLFLGEGFFGLGLGEFVIVLGGYIGIFLGRAVFDFWGILVGGKR